MSNRQSTLELISKKSEEFTSLWNHVLGLDTPLSDYIFTDEVLDFEKVKILSTRIITNIAKEHKDIKTQDIDFIKAILSASIVACSSTFITDATPTFATLLQMCQSIDCRDDELDEIADLCESKLSPKFLIAKTSELPKGLTDEEIGELVQSGKCELEAPDETTMAELMSDYMTTAPELENARFILTQINSMIDTFAAYLDSSSDMESVMQFMLEGYDTHITSGIVAILAKDGNANLDLSIKLA